MLKTDVLDIKGKKVSEIELNEAVFGIEVNDIVVHQALVNYLANQRQGTQSTKTRSEVRGGGIKPWRQKGTGRARQGSIRAPQWYHGGVVFGPQTNANHTKKQNKKERRLALKSALAYKEINKELIIVDNFNLETNKTKEALAVLNGLNATKNVLVVVNELNDNVILATRNISYVTLLEANEINVLDIVRADKMIVTLDALNTIEEVLK